MNWPATVINVNKFHYLRGGSERYYFDLTAILAERGHRVLPFSMRHPSNRAAATERYFVPEVRWDDRRGAIGGIGALAHVVHSRAAARNIESLVREEGGDIAHAHNISHQLSPSILGPLRKRGIPVVQTLHDYKLICPNYRLFTHGETCERCRGGDYWNAFRQRCNRGEAMGSLALAVESTIHRATGAYARGVDLFIAPSRFLMNKAIEFGVPAERLRHIPYPMALPAAGALHSAGESNAGITDGAPYFLYTGRLAEEKGLPTLLRAAALVPEARVLIAGEGEMRERLEALAARAPGVRWLGHLPQGEVARLQLGALAAIVPSEWYENLPLAVMEACAAGVPVIASDIGGIPEMVESGKTGYLFPPKDAEALARAMRAMLADRAGARAMGERARALVAERYDPSRHYDAIMAAYADARTFAREGTPWRWRKLP
ncbi:MAG: glycosyltransferase family 4 protein [bacterium]